MASLSVRDRESLLAEPHVAALSVADGPDRGPLTLPIWYQYRPGGVAQGPAHRGGRPVHPDGRPAPADRPLRLGRGPGHPDGPGDRRAAARDHRAVPAPGPGPGLPGFRPGRAGRADRDPPAAGAVADRRPRARSRAPTGRLTGGDGEAGVLDGVVAEAGQPGRAGGVGPVGERG